MLISVIDIATRLAGPSGDVGHFRERLAFWAKTGLLRPYNQKLLGKGVPRLYEHASTVRAALLNQATDQNLDVAAWEYARNAADLAREAAGDWARGDHRPKLLEVKWLWTPRGTPPGPGIPKLCDQPVYDPTAAGVTYINLSFIFKRLVWTEADERADASLQIPAFTRRRGRKETKKPTQGLRRKKG